MSAFRSGFLRDDDGALVVSGLAESVVSADNTGVTDARTAIQAAITDLAGNGTVTLPAGTFLLDNASGPLVLPTAAAGLRIRGAGKGATILKLSSNCKRAFDMTGGSDGGVFKNITVEDLTVDATSVTYTVNQHILIGNLVDGSWTNRRNFDNIVVRRCSTLVTAQAAATPSTQSVSIVARQTVGGEGGSTASYAKNILVEDCEFQGTFGVAVLSAVGSGTGTAVCDNIRLHRVRHTTGTVPPSSAVTSASGLAQLGGAHGTHGYCEIIGCSSANSWDVGVEVDNFQMAVVERLDCVDAYSHAVLFRNMAPPTDVDTQKYICRDLRHRTLSADPDANIYNRGVVLGTTGSTTNGTGDTTNGGTSIANASGSWRKGQTITGSGIQAGTYVTGVSGSTLTLSQPATATATGVTLSYSDFVMGDVLIEGCVSSFGSVLADPSTRTGLSVNTTAGYAKSVTIRNHTVLAKALNAAPAVGRHYVFLDVGSMLWNADVTLDNVSVHLGGTIANTACFYEAIRVTATECNLRVAKFAYDLTGLNTTLGNAVFMALALGYQATARVRGTIDGVKMSTARLSTNPYGIVFGSSLTITTGNQIRVRGSDFYGLSLGSGANDYLFQAAQHGKVVIESPVYERTNAAGPLVSPASATVPASGASQQNTDYKNTIIHLSGGTGTKVEVSKDNSTFYTVLDQSAGAFAHSFSVPAGWYWRPTYTVAPTGTKWPAQP